MGQYETLSAFFRGDYLELRFEKVLHYIKEQNRQVSVMLMAYLDKNEATVGPIERQKVVQFLSDLQEVVFAAENLHIYLVGMNRVSSTEEVRARKTIEINNQGQWISRHLPAMWDAASIYARFEHTFGKFLQVHPVARLHYFESIGPMVVDMSKPPYAFLKLAAPQECERMTSLILASALARAVMEQKELTIMIDEGAAMALGKIQSYTYDKLALSILTLIKTYQNALGVAPMAESEEALRLIDEIDCQVAQLKRQYAEVFVGMARKVPQASPPLSVDLPLSSSAVQRMQELLRRRLGR